MAPLLITIAIHPSHHVTVCHIMLPSHSISFMSTIHLPYIPVCNLILVIHAPQTHATHLTVPCVRMLHSPTAPFPTPFRHVPCCSQLIKIHLICAFLSIFCAFFARHQPSYFAYPILPCSCRPASLLPFQTRAACHVAFHGVLDSLFYFHIVNLYRVHYIGIVVSCIFCALRVSESFDISQQSNQTVRTQHSNSTIPHTVPALPQSKLIPWCRRSPLVFTFVCMTQNQKKA